MCALLSCQHFNILTKQWCLIYRGSYCIIIYNFEDMDLKETVKSVPIND
jgi:hypothetical protein